jgi:hypothetical protein
MNTDLVYVAIGLGIGVLALVALLYFLVFSPSAQETRNLRRRAKHDFETAPGAVHLRMMRPAHTAYAQRQRQIRHRLATADKRRARLAGARERELRAALEDAILRTGLSQIPGIGAGLRSDLYRFARKRGGLAALPHAASHVSGIGPVRQATINGWLAHVHENMSTYLAEDFPGKDAILARYAGELPALEREVSQLTADDREITPRLERLEAAMGPLLQVKPGTLYAAMRHPEPYTEDVAVYLRGVYAEWEPAPDWFTEVVEGAGS